MIKGIGNKVFILGIGGISLSAIAEILVSNGHEVLGYDKKCSNLTKRLEDLSINIYYTENFINKLKSVDTVIYTSAFNEDYKGIAEAKKLNLQVLTRAEALSLISASFDNVLAVAGSHGKTTTTAILTTILERTMSDFTAHVGGEMVEFNTNVLIRGNNKLFVTEACEYKRNFLSLSPNIGIILNLDLDHTDVYNSSEEILSAFVDFSNRITEGGLLILNLDAKGARELIKRTKKNKKIITYSLNNKDADYYVKNYYTNNGCVEFFVSSNDGRFNGYKFKFPSFFEHNLYNALASIIAILELGVNKRAIKQSLIKFCGVRRRFEYIGKINGADVILDYAHHPKELEKVIKSTKLYTNGQVFVLFQPHTYSRTKFFWAEFIKSLSYADSIVLYPIYPAREKAIIGVTSKRMAQDLRRIKKVCYYNDSLELIKTYLGYFVGPKDVVLVLGAGDIDEFKKFV